MKTLVRVATILAVAAVVAGLAWVLVPQATGLAGPDRERPDFEQFQPGDSADGAADVVTPPTARRERPGGAVIAVGDLAGTLVKMGVVVTVVAGAGWLLTRRRRRFSASSGAA